MNRINLTTLRLTRVLESINCGLMVEDEKRGIIFVNRTFLEMFGIDMPVDDFLSAARDTAMRMIKSVFSDEDYFIERMENLPSAGETVFGEEFTLRDGRVFEGDYSPLFNGDACCGHVWIYKDISDMKDLENKLFELAVTDELTQAYNRRKFQEELARNIDISLRFGTELSLIMIDLDLFRSVNDRFGQDAGDEVLMMVSASILSGKRRVDILGRWGGEEFLLLLPGTGIDSAASLAEKWRIKISSVAYRLCPEPVTASLGVAQFRDTEDAGGLLARVEEALLRAKGEGRNRVCRAK